MNMKQRAVKNRQFREMKKNIESIFSHYRFCKLKLDNIDNALLNSKKSPTVIKQYKEYIKTIDLILSALDEEEAYIIRAKEIQRKNMYDLGYCQQTFYETYREAATNFLKYLS